MAAVVGTGVDRRTGRVISGWSHVVQCVRLVLTTSFGERVMREHVGSLVPRVLGQNLTKSNLLRLYTAIYAALIFEPRFDLKQVAVKSSTTDLQNGILKLVLRGIYRPRAHLGDFTSAGEREIEWGNR